jgi:hypothetical protein
MVVEIRLLFLLCLHSKGIDAENGWFRSADAFRAGIAESTADVLIKKPSKKNKREFIFNETLLQLLILFLQFIYLV